MATYRQLGFLRVEVNGKKEPSCIGLAMVKFQIFKLAPPPLFSWRLVTLQYCSSFCHTLT